MRLRSRGLGRKELVMDFREYEVVREGEELVVVGTIRDPVTWDFSIRICEDDVTGLTRLLLRKPMLAHLLRSIFRRRKRHHWGEDLAKHLAEGEARRQITRTNAPERARAALEPIARPRRVRELRPPSEKKPNSPDPERSAAGGGG